MKGTVFHGLYFSAYPMLKLQAFSNANWAGDLMDCRSTTGYCFYLGDSLVLWHSKKQTIVIRLSIEAEYRALADIVVELLWLRRLLGDMGVSHFGATTLYYDN